MEYPYEGLSSSLDLAHDLPLFFGRDDESSIRIPVEVTKGFEQRFPLRSVPQVGGARVDVLGVKGIFPTHQTVGFARPSFHTNADESFGKLLSQRKGRTDWLLHRTNIPWVGITRTRPACFDTIKLKGESMTAIAEEGLIRGYKYAIFEIQQDRCFWWVERPGGTAFWRGNVDPVPKNPEEAKEQIVKTLAKHGVG